MRLGWIVWFAVATICAAYAITGYISSTTNTVAIALNPGSTASTTVFRLYDGTVRASLAFQGDHRMRPELGDWATSSDRGQGDILRFDRPGGDVRIEISSNEVGPVLFEAMPKSSYSRNEIGRDLTPNLSLEPGVWRWPPPDEPRLPLKPGFTKLQFRVASVDPRLQSETIKLHVL